jgi:hypothetical protein
MMRVSLLSALLLITILFTPERPRDAKPRSDPKEPILDLCLEVQAARTLYLLRAKPDQLRKLQEIARAVETPDRERAKSRASDEYRSVLGNLRVALAADDQDEVEDLEDRLNGLTESEEPELDDVVPITDAARKRVPEALRIFNPRQIAEFLASIAEEIGDPQERLVAALEKVRSDREDDWEQLRDDLADDLSGLMAGLDAARSKSVRSAIVSLLNKIRALDADAFDKQKAELTKAAREIAGATPPTQVLTHAIERDIAHLLSNPRLSAALELRLKRAK